MSPLKVSFLGDISLNDNYISLFKNNINPFLSLEMILNQSDYVVGNLECTAKGEKGENTLKKPRLTTTVETLNYLNTIKLNLACLAQNHVYDHLEDGFTKTTDFLSKYKIQYSGAGFTAEEAAKEVIIEKKGMRIGILNYITNDTNPNIPENASIFLNFFDKSKAINDIQKLKLMVDHVIIELHWGGRVEGGLYPDFYQNKLAKILIDNGADLIIGHHSHTFQPFEIYKGKYIFYSLGNFCFSDFWFEGEFNPMPLRRRITSLINVEFEKNTYKIEIRFFRNDFTTFSTLSKYHQKIKVRNFIYKYLLKYKIFWNFYFINKTYLLPIFFFMQRVDITLAEMLKRIWKSLLHRIRSLHTI